MSFSIMVYHKILNIVPCAIQQDLIYTIYLIYTSWHLLIPNSQPFPPFPTALATTSLFSMSMSLYLFHRYVHLSYFSFHI